MLAPQPSLGWGCRRADPGSAPIHRRRLQSELGRLLGRGYTWSVFEATHYQSGQVVALKVLAPEFPAAPAEVERFVREVQVAQPLATLPTQ